MYFKWSIGLFFELRTQNNFQNKPQRHEHNQFISQNSKHVNFQDHTCL
jgi:hypothetical protein